MEDGIWKFFCHQLIKPTFHSEHTFGRCQWKNLQNIRGTRVIFNMDVSLWQLCASADFSNFDYVLGKLTLFFEMYHDQSKRTYES